MIKLERLAILSRVEEHLSVSEHQLAKSWQKKLQLKAPDSIENHYLIGLIALTQNQVTQAIESFERVANHFRQDVKFHNNLGSAYLEVNDVGKAIDAFQAALVIEPEKALTSYNLTCAYIASQDGEAALQYIDPLLQKHPKNDQYWCVKADALRLLHKYKDTNECYKTCLQLNDNHIAANSNLGVILASFGQFNSALSYSQKAVHLAPEMMLTHMNLGKCLSQLERFDEAMEAFADAYDINHDSAELCAEIANMWTLNGDSSEAVSWYQKSLVLKVNNLPATAGMARIMLQNGQSDEVIEFLKEQLNIHDDAPELLHVYADALWDEGDVPAALEVIKKLLPENQQNPKYLSKAAQILASSGDLDAAMHNYQEALRLNPNCIPALNGMAVKQSGKFSHESAQHMHKLIQSEHIKDLSKISLHNGLAYYFDGNQAWEQAADHMQQANELQWKTQSNRHWDYDKNKFTQFCQQIKDTFTTEYFSTLKRPVTTTCEPVFIVAMPRSGTTLTEQILARHPDVLGIGERNFLSQSMLQLLRKTPSVEKALKILPNVSQAKLDQIVADYLSKLQRLKYRDGKADAIHVVDKMPDNYSYIGWILTLFPDAKIIHCRRDPRDVALSCWMTQFGKIQWASRFEDLLHRIEQYQDIMSHWRKVVPQRFMEINYEDLVENQEKVSRDMIAYLGLDWDEKCLNFYQSDQIVRTASISQVRKPIYKKSVGKWKRYAPYIPALDHINTNR